MEKAMLPRLSGSRGEIQRNEAGHIGLVVLVLCLFCAAGLPARPQGAAAAANAAPSPFVTFEAPGAGTGELQGTAAIAINAAEQVAGVFIDGNGAMHGFVRAASGAITPFDAKDAGAGKNQGTIPTGINASGVIAGTYIDGNVVSHGFVRAANGAIAEFDAPGAGTAKNRGTAAMRINDAGTIVGFFTTGSYSTNSTYHGFERAADGTIATIDDPNAGTGEGANSEKQGTSAYAINASGTIAGSYKDSNTVQHGFVRTAAGAFTVIDPAGVGTCVSNHGGKDGGTSVSSIDAAGDVAGYYTDTGCAQHAFVRGADGKIATFDAPGADTNPCASSGFGKLFCGTLSMGIDTAGAIAGGYVDPDAVLHGFVRTANGTFTKLDAPGASTSGIVAGTAAMGINDAGTVVGTYIDANANLHGFVYTPAVPLRTATTLGSTPNPSVYLEPVTLTATVSSSAGAPPNGDSISFMNGKTTLGTGTLKGGEASITTTALPLGADSIAAFYTGDAHFAASTSNAVSEKVGKARSFTKLTAKPNPSSYGETVTFTANVTGQFGGTPTGKATFYESFPLENVVLQLGTATLSKGTATYATSKLGAGTGLVSAVYSGSSDFSASASNSVSQVVGKATTATTLASSLNPSKASQSVTFTATVKGENGSSPIGSVNFKDGTKVLKIVALSGGVAKFATNALAAGKHSLTAVYGGSADSSSSSGALTQTVN